MPKLGPNMTEGTVVEWRKSVGDEIELGDVIAEIETDKASVELEAQVSGVMAEILVAPGEIVAIGTPIAQIHDRSGQPATEEAATAVDAGAQSPAEAAAEPAFSESEKVIRASPRARQLALDQQVDLAATVGTGPEGLITGDDVLRQAARQTPGGAAPSKAAGVPPLSPMRRAIAEQTARSHATIPPFAVTRDIRVDQSLELRAGMSRQGFTVTVNDLVLKATIQALHDHPNLNAWFVDDALQLRDHVNLAIAIEVEGGLIAPVLPHCQDLSLEDLAAGTRALVERARSQKLQAADVQDATITVSNLGMLGVTQFTAIISPPQVAIVAVGAIRVVPTFEGDAIVPANYLTITVCADHRAVDGAEVAKFLGRMATHLEGGFANA
jgi:pyruvate dehydrogenase E2 component (dihydrolipoamide acetyltransferase)